MHYNTSPLGAWIKALSDAASTRTQITYAIIGMVVYIMLRGAQMARTVGDIVALLNASAPLVLLVLSAWFGSKAYWAFKGAGGSIEQNLDIPNEDPLARLERLEG